MRQFGFAAAGGNCCLCMRSVRRRVRMTIKVRLLAVALQLSIHAACSQRVSRVPAVAGLYSSMSACSHLAVCHRCLAVHPAVLDGKHAPSVRVLRDLHVDRRCYTLTDTVTHSTVDGAMPGIC